MKTQRAAAIILLSTIYYLLSTQLSFAPITEDVDPTEVMRNIEMQRQETKHAQQVEQQHRQDIQDQDSKLEVASQNNQKKQIIKFWLVTLGIVALGTFILSRIKSDKKNK